MSRGGGSRRVLVPLPAKVLAAVVMMVLVAVPGVAALVDDRDAVFAPRAPEVTGLVVSQVLGVRDAPGRGTPGAAGDRARTAQWGWPLVGAPPVARAFDLPAQRWLPGHRGVDLVGVAGEQVFAVDAGVVTFSGTIAGVGMVSVTHEDGLRSTYQPVEDRQDRGERVGRGQRLGVLGTTGSHCALHDCLHLGAVRGRDAYVDPLPLLLGAELALLPVAP
ncbi:M23 family metallopeptidase [Ornithinimicrobium pratense]|uniref:M23 family metallopeptidase n=1 Tax=Ornithinimicrobium pratense TaxID=2593973 RepID=A0A5J6V765_9MICO|nr:M23 family metallopeptidase [Ornithinimicrobium pratense]QFG68961.1 M23 family metallopeptidase [Ornithinimicrobium pratense]